MAAPATTPGLTPTDLEQIRTALASGRRPKVVFTDGAGQIAGQVGQVVELTDPAGSDEWIVVHFGRDELPFSPSDLAVPGRGTTTVPARSSGRRTAKVVTATEPEFVLGRKPAPREGKTVLTDGAPADVKPAEVNGTAAKAAAVNGTASKAAAANGSAAKADMAAAKTDSSGSKADRATGTGSAVNGTAPAGRGGGTPKTGRTARPKAPASLVVTLAYADREWTVAATQGSRSRWPSRTSSGRPRPCGWSR